MLTHSLIFVDISSVGNLRNTRLVHWMILGFWWELIRTCLHLWNTNLRAPRILHLWNFLWLKVSQRPSLMVITWWRFCRWHIPRTLIRIKVKWNLSLLLWRIGRRHLDDFLLRQAIIHRYFVSILHILPIQIFLHGSRFVELLILLILLLKIFFILVWQVLFPVERLFLERWRSFILIMIIINDVLIVFTSLQLFFDIMLSSFNFISVDGAFTVVVFRFFCMFLYCWE